MTCGYCEGNVGLPLREADKEHADMRVSDYFGEISAFFTVDGVEHEATALIRFCPMCGRDLRGGDEG